MQLDSIKKAKQRNKQINTYQCAADICEFIFRVEFLRGRFTLSYVVIRYVICNNKILNMMLSLIK